MQFFWKRGVRLQSNGSTQVVVHTGDYQTWTSSGKDGAGILMEDAF